MNATSPLVKRVRGSHGEQRLAIDLQGLDGRVPAHSEDAELAVISAVLLDGRVLDEILDVLPSGEMFYADAHRRIYDCAVEIHAKGQPIDLATIANALRDADRLQAVGGLPYIAKIIDATPAVAHVRAHAKIVAEKSRVRRLVEQCMLTAAESYGRYGDPQEFIDRHEQAVFEIAQVREGRDYATASTVAQACMDLARRAHDGPGGITGVPTGLALVDDRTGGYQAGELVILAARPGMGKTALVLGMALHVAAIPQTRDDTGELVRDAAGEPIGPGYVVALFSLEMPKEQLGVRAICHSAGLDVSKVRRGKLTPREYGIYTQHAEWFSRLPIVIDDTPAVGLFEIRAKARRIQRQFPGRQLLIVVDYLQLMGAPQGVREREEQVSVNSRGLKAISKEFRAPVIALSQLNRAVETRAGKDKRPQLSDLRESGAIEQDADIVQFIYRPEYYVEQAGDEVDDEQRGYAEIVTAKQRNGPTGRDVVAYRSASTKFENPTENDLRRWGLDDNGEIEQPKMFAPGSKLPGAVGSREART